MPTKKAKILEYLINHPPKEGDTGYYNGVAKACGCSAEHARRTIREAGAPNVKSTIQSKRNGLTLADNLYKFLLKSKKRWKLTELSDHFDTGIGKVKEAIEQLHKQGKNIQVVEDNLELSRDVPRSKPTFIEPEVFKGNRKFKFGVTADNHLGSRYERLDVLDALFNIWQAQGVKTVFQLGNMIDGEARFNKFDIHQYGLGAQVRYFVENWPQRKGMQTKFVTGDDHEGWYIQREGIDVGRFIQSEAQEAGRKDLIYLGHMEHDIVLKAKNGQAIMRLIHAGGGSAYATSYSAQKIVESYQGGEKPHILLMGHYHKAEYGYPREVHCLQAGCTCDQTPFMRKRKIQAHVGGWTIDFEQDDDGIIHNFRVQWHAFYDKGHYDKAWKYRWK
jgi:hypothetical protein